MNGKMINVAVPRSVTMAKCANRRVQTNGRTAYSVRKVNQQIVSIVLNAKKVSNPKVIKKILKANGEKV